MNKPWIILIFAFGSLGTSVPLFAQDLGDWSASLKGEAGFQQPSGQALGPYGFTQARMSWDSDLLSDLTLDLLGEADAQASTRPMPASWPLYPFPNAWGLEAFHVSSGGDSLYAARLDRASLHFSSGPFDGTLGLLAPDWGSGGFYRPTDFFFPLQPLTWERDIPLGSEGLDVSTFLFDDLSLEASTRWLQGGFPEEVVRLVDKGIGLSVTPSFAFMKGRDGLGWEAVGTFPDFQARLEGVEWFYPSSPDRTQWIAGLSTVKQGITYSAELFNDGTSEVLGSLSTGPDRDFYCDLSAQGDLGADWTASAAVVKAFEGGPFLVWPRLRWDLGAGWSLQAQAQCPFGEASGPLALLPSRTGLSAACSF